MKQFGTTGIRGTPVIAEASSRPIGRKGFLARIVESELMSRFTIHDLASIIDARAASGGDASYTRKLLDKGREHCAKKLGEEAIETVLAAVEEDRARLIAEAADLIYHLLVVLEARGISLADVEAQLAERTRQSGLTEKASRNRG